LFLLRQIIYFNSFQFKNGNTPRTKYFIILANTADNVIIASLPTRTNTVPSFVTVDHGCINIDERCYNSYLFKKDKIIGDKGFFFDMPTFIYGDQVEDYKVELLETNYIEDIDYVIVDTLIKEEFAAVINCLKNSSSVKFKIKKRLQL
jgi:hypothetical protein